VLKVKPGLLRALADEGRFPAISLGGLIRRDVLPNWTRQNLRFGIVNQFAAAYGPSFMESVNHFSIQQLARLESHLNAPPSIPLALIIKLLLIPSLVWLAAEIARLIN
jgi:hypothetical protein